MSRPSPKPRDLLVLRFGAVGQFAIRRFKDPRTHDFEGVPSVAPVQNVVAMATLIAVAERVDLWYSDDDRNHGRIAICRN